MSQKLPDSDGLRGLARMAEVIDQLRREYDPRRAEAEQAAYADLAAKYPGQFVAFTDTWDGDRLTRDVIAASPDLAVVHAALRALPDFEARRREIEVTDIPDPADDAIDVPSVWFDDEAE